MIRPEIDGRLAARVREVADSLEDHHILSVAEKRRILIVAADLLEEYIISHEGSRHD